MTARIHADKSTALPLTHAFLILILVALLPPPQCPNVTPHPPTPPAPPQGFSQKGQPWAAGDYRELKAAFEERIGEETVAQIAGYMAKDLGIVAGVKQVQQLLGGLVPQRLMAVVEAGMRAWLQVKGCSTSYKLQVSGCREGMGRWQLGGWCILVNATQCFGCTVPGPAPVCSC